MDVSQRLIDYLTAKQHARCGSVPSWRADYENQFKSEWENKWAWLAGHYSGMLDTLISVLGGEDLVLQLLSADGGSTQHVVQQEEDPGA